MIVSLPPGMIPKLSKAFAALFFIGICSFPVSADLWEIGVQNYYKQTGGSAEQTCLFMVAGYGDWYLEDGSLITGAIFLANFGLPPRDVCYLTGNLGSIDLAEVVTYPDGHTPTQPQGPPPFNNPNTTDIDIITAQVTSYEIAAAAFGTMIFLIGWE